MYMEEAKIKAHITKDEFMNLFNKIEIDNHTSKKVGYLRKKLDIYQKYDLIRLFYNKYYQNNKDKKGFEVEYFNIQNDLLHNIIPLELEYLNIKSIYNDIYIIVKK